MSEPVSSADSAWHDRLLRRYDLQPRPFKALLRALLLMDLRSFHYGNATGTGANELLPPLFWVVGQFLTISLLLSAFLIGRADVYFFSFAGLATCMLLVLSAVVVEFNEAALDPGDAGVLGHRPLHPRTYAAARLGNFLCYVALLGTALTIFPAIVGAGLRDAGPLFLPAYAFASALASVATASGILLLYLALGAGEALDQVKSVLAWTQILVLLVVFYGAQLALNKATGGVELFAAKPPEWLHSLPPAWIAWWVTEVSRAPRPGLLVHAAGGAAVVLVLAGAAGWRLSLAYARTQASGSAWRRVTLPEPAAAGTVGAGLARLWAAGREQAAGYWLTRTMFRRDAELSMRSWPTLGMAAAALVLGVFTDQFADPLTSSGPQAVLPIAVYALLASAVPLVAQNMSFSRDPNAAWLLRAAPLRDPARFMAGARQAMLASVFLPVILVFFAALAFVWRDPLHAAIHAGITWLVLEGVARISFVSVLRGVPFAQPMARGAATGAIMIVSASLTGVCMIVGLVHFYAARHPAALAGFTAGLLLAVLVLDRWAARRIRATFFAGRA